MDPGVGAMHHGAEVSRLGAMDHGAEAPGCLLTWIRRGRELGATDHGAELGATDHGAELPGTNHPTPSLPVHIFISPLGSLSPKTEHEFGFNIWTIKSLICSIDLEEPECHVVEKVANQAMAGRPVVRTSTSRFLAVFQYLCAFVVILAR
ncbi:uncharacterized protein LOC110435064 isoform X2 [Sorghum bicolor]|uniref:uncharacterized protein LOC110433063 isoform X2 n=1 Tax=Sorghum bicolor TaxID=4558 RepID=UPI000B42597D|nr:uncharacterized protein LOC110433063 isoform X2 [Sorghum bicolor]XP_021316060.1 uncharacterized protein LOC110435064 isoform X2 [Sorghum bicolor]|eukprot:XP_021310348.1 uncharacterized protein LOC110433063 isoform X2 [Sorghum bicolor]